MQPCGGYIHEKWHIIIIYIHIYIYNYYYYIPYILYVKLMLLEQV